MEGPYDHCVDLLINGTFVFHRLPAHLGCVVLTSAGGACGAEGRAVYVPVGSALLFSMALATVVVADAAVGGHGSG